MFNVCRHSILTFNGLSNDISLVVLAQNFIISTCLRSVEKHETVIESVNYLCKHTIIRVFIFVHTYIYMCNYTLSCVYIYSSFSLCILPPIA